MSGVRHVPPGRQLAGLLLQTPRLTLAVAESLTAGHVQSRVGGVSGASKYFLGGITAYTLEEKVRHLGVDRAAAKRVKCVSAEIAGQMARGVCQLFGADVGVATTGYAEPSADDDVMMPFAWWAVALRAKRGRFVLHHGRVECPGCSRRETQEIVADAALAELIAVLQQARG
ncbi:MAG: nicotinamide-nucleotide amidohydrolase family protein [Opitutus sp.]